MIKSQKNSVASIAIFLLYNKMLSLHKKGNIILEMKFEDKTKSE